mgnify:CR=1 FL=1
MNADQTALLIEPETLVNSLGKDNLLIVDLSKAEVIVSAGRGIGADFG